MSKAPSASTWRPSPLQGLTLLCTTHGHLAPEVVSPNQKVSPDVDPSGTGRTQHSLQSLQEESINRDLISETPCLASPARTAVEPPVLEMLPARLIGLLVRQPKALLLREGCYRCWTSRSPIQLDLLPLHIVAAALHGRLRHTTCLHQACWKAGPMVFTWDTWRCFSKRFNPVD